MPAGLRCLSDTDAAIPLDAAETLGCVLAQPIQAPPARLRDLAGSAICDDVTPPRSDSECLPLLRRQTMRRGSAQTPTRRLAPTRT
jgi:hypothetical protein